AAGATVAGIITAVRREGRTLLNELESRQVLAAYGLPVAKTCRADSEAEAVRIADQFGYPVVLKPLSDETIDDATDAEQSVDSRQAFRAAYLLANFTRQSKRRAEFPGVMIQSMPKKASCELILGSTIDAQFGPVLFFAAGGRWTATYSDRAFGLPPLNTTLARRMMERTRIYHVMADSGLDVGELEQLLVYFSHIVIEQPWIRQIDVNPLLAAADGLAILDAQIMLHAPGMAESDLPCPAIRPY